MSYWLQPFKQISNNDKSPFYSVTLKYLTSCIRYLVNFSFHFFTISDFDECANDSNLCESNADCINIAGSYECQCKDGYAGDSCQGIRSSSREGTELGRQRLTINIITNLSRRKQHFTVTHFTATISTTNHFYSRSGLPSFILWSFRSHIKDGETVFPYFARF